MAAGRAPSRALAGLREVSAQLSVLLVVLVLLLPETALAASSVPRSFFHAVHRRAAETQSLKEQRQECINATQPLQLQCSDIGSWHGIQYQLDLEPAIVNVIMDLQNFDNEAPPGGSCNLTHFFAVCQPTIVIRGNNGVMPRGFRVPEELQDAQLLRFEGSFPVTTMHAMMSSFGRLHGLTIASNPNVAVSPLLLAAHRRI